HKHRLKNLSLQFMKFLNLTVCRLIYCHAHPRKTYASSSKELIWIRPCSISGQVYWPRCHTPACPLHKKTERLCSLAPRPPSPKPYPTKSLNRSASCCDRQLNGTLPSFNITSVTVSCRAFSS